MKKLFLLLGLGTLLMASPALAQIDPDEDGVGIYFDPCACNYCVTLDEGEHLGYVVITHPTAPEGVAGWELEISWEGPAVVLEYIYEGMAINVETPPSFAVGLGEPISNPYMFPAVVVLTMRVLLLDTADPVNFFIDGIQFHSLPERVPAYVDGGNLDNIIELRQSTGGPDFPVATINGDCAVATEESSWSDVKQLFR
jgi:hypothetical protein